MLYRIKVETEVFGTLSFLLPSSSEKANAEVIHACFARNGYHAITVRVGEQEAFEPPEGARFGVFDTYHMTLLPFQGSEKDAYEYAFGVRDSTYAFPVVLDERVMGGACEDADPRVVYGFNSIRVSGIMPYGLYHRFKTQVASKEFIAATMDSFGFPIGRARHNTPSKILADPSVLTRQSEVPTFGPAEFTKESERAYMIVCALSGNVLEHYASRRYADLAAEMDRFPERIQRTLDIVAGRASSISLYSLPIFQWARRSYKVTRNEPASNYTPRRNYMAGADLTKMYAEMPPVRVRQDLRKEDGGLDAWGLAGAGGVSMLEGCYFKTRNEAVASVPFVATMNGVLSSSLTPTKWPVSGSSDLDAWRVRESNRITTGLYMAVPWAEARWWTRHDLRVKHFAHVSEKDPDLLAYTQSRDKGNADIQTPIKVGVYLTKYFSDVLTVEQINDYARRWKTDTDIPVDRVKLQIAGTPDDSTAVYAHGPLSCMRDSEGVVAYGGDADLKVAFIGKIDPDDPSGAAVAKAYDARAVVWPERKLYVRVYPSPESSYFARYGGLESSTRRYASRAATTLRMLLEREGYTRAASFEGARMNAVPAKNRQVGTFHVPYLDGSVQTLRLVVPENGDMHFLVTRGDAHIAATSTEGYARCAVPAAVAHRWSGGSSSSSSSSLFFDDDDDENDVPEWVCERCDYESFDEADEHESVYVLHGGAGRVRATWCAACARENAFWCSGTDSHYSDSDFDSITTQDTNMTACCDYAEEHFFYCSESGDWFEDESCGARVRDSAYDPNSTQWWCNDVIEEQAFYCSSSETYYDSTQFVAVTGLHDDIHTLLYEHEEWIARAQDVLLKQIAANPSAYEKRVCICTPGAPPLPLPYPGRVF
jgi:hypothetical protein